jgi:predicted Rossmann fold nucleotide-binding protein DprA/Smf involved in DNA uptake
VIAAIARREDGPVSAADLERELGMANNRIRAQLLALCEAGVLQPLPGGRSERVRWYQPLKRDRRNSSVAL